MIGYDVGGKVAEMKMNAWTLEFYETVSRSARYLERLDVCSALYIGECGER